MPPTPPDGSRSPDPVRARIDETCLHFEAGWRSGARPRLTEFLDAVPEGHRPALLSGLLEIELRYRRLGGETPSPEEYVTALGRYGEVIRAAFDWALPPGATTTPATAGAQDEGPAAFPAIPGYEILGRLGEGGMGVVYRARQASLGRFVALKLLRRPGGDVEEARFRREAESAARVSHENVVRVYDLGVAQGAPYVSMELVEGGSLNRHLAGAPPAPQQRAAELVAKLARAAHAAHAAGVIHRDLKPANVLLAFAPAEPERPGPAPWWERPHCPKIADFGLAKWADDSALTLTGEVFGTPAYMAPEQASGRSREAGPRADVYALGAILYELLVGRPPFRGPSRDVLVQVQNDPPTPPRRLRPDLHPDLEAACLKCLEKAPSRRYATAQDLAEDLERFARGEPTRARPRRWPQKAARWLASRPLLLAAVGLAALACAAAPFAARVLAPQRPAAPEEAEKKPFRQVLGPESTLRTDAEQGCYVAESFQTVLWELTDDPGHDRYRFSAEVRHEGSAGASQVGIYFGRRERSPEPGERRGAFYTLCYADLGGLSGERRPDDSSQVAVQTNLFVRPTRLDVASNPIASKSFRPERRPGRPGPWRKLVVAVTPEGLEASWQREGGRPEAVANLTAASVSRRHAEQRLINGQVDPRFSAIQVDYAPRGGLGLYVRGGKASFRRVALEPLAAEAQGRE